MPGPSRHHSGFSLKCSGHWPLCLSVKKKMAKVTPLLHVHHTETTTGSYSIFTSVSQPEAGENLVFVTQPCKKASLSSYRVSKYILYSPLQSTNSSKCISSYEPNSSPLGSINTWVTGKITRSLPIGRQKRRWSSSKGGREQHVPLLAGINFPSLHGAAGHLRRNI